MVKPRQCFAGLSGRGVTEFDAPLVGFSSNERGDAPPSAPGNGGGRLGEAGKGGGRSCATGSGGGRLSERACAGFAGTELGPGLFDGLDCAVGLAGGNGRMAALGCADPPLASSAVGALDARAPSLTGCGRGGFATLGRGALAFSKFDSRPTSADGGRRVAAMFAPEGLC
ncbi:MAG TPA: hypothetical protein VJV79_22520 [Polyangiaceae bacterium]|nr:hypothetical protein [Polyangiaceae bacterium]